MFRIPALVSRRAFAPAVLGLAAIALLTGCGYDGKVTGAVGDALQFTVSADRQQELEVTVLDLTPVSAADAESFGIDAGSSDVYFIHYSVATGDILRWADWAVVADGEVVLGDRAQLPDEANCDDRPEVGDPCVLFLVPSGDAVSMVRYYGVNSGYNKGSGVNSKEWAGWTVD